MCEFDLFAVSDYNGDILDGPDDIEDDEDDGDDDHDDDDDDDDDEASVWPTSPMSKHCIVVSLSKGHQQNYNDDDDVDDDDDDDENKDGNLMKIKEG